MDELGKDFLVHVTMHFSLKTGTRQFLHQDEQSALVHLAIVWDV